jgi:hypothetical protein
MTTTIVRFDEIPDGRFFAPVGLGHRRLLKHVLPPFGNMCATTEDIEMVLIRDEVQCYLFAPPGPALDAQATEGT